MAQTEPAVLVVAYGRPDLLDQALEALGTGHQVVVIDNGGSDEIARACEVHGARYHRSHRNVGFAAGVNAGLAHVSDDQDVLLLNPDARLGWRDVQALHRSMHALPRVAAVAPRLVRAGGVQERTAWPIPRPWTTWRGAVGRGRPGHGDRLFLSGAVLLLRREALNEVGSFDERFFLYAEECDWQLRALRLGWSVTEVPAVTAQHVGAASSTDPDLRAAYFHAAAERFLRKWYGTAGWQVFRAGALLSALRRLVVPGLREAAVRQEQLRAFRLYLRGPVRSLSARGLR